MTKKEALQELRTDYLNRTGRRLRSDGRDNVFLYHGTSAKNEKKIIENKLFKNGFFMGNRTSVNGDSVGAYAKIRAKQANEKGNGKVIKMLVNPKYLFVNGAGEIESTNDLYFINNVWTLKKDSNIVDINKLSAKKIANKLKVDIRFAHNVFTSLRFYFHNEDARNFKDLNKFLKEDFIAYYLDMSEDHKRKFSKEAKDIFFVSKEVFKSNLLRLKKHKVEDFF